MKTKAVCQNAGDQVGEASINRNYQGGKLLRTFLSNGAGSTGRNWFVGALAMAMAFAVCQRASAIDPYPGEGNPVLCATVIATGGDVTATFITGSGCYYDY